MQSQHRLLLFAFDTDKTGLWSCGSFTNSFGIIGVIRAQSWDEAVECAVDESMLDADPDYLAEYGSDDTGELPEGCYFRGGIPSNQTETRRTLIAQEDLNGCRLDELTEDMVEEWGLEVLWRDE